MNVYRVNYYVGGQPKTSFVCADVASQAADFLGVRDGSAAVSELAKDVEVIGIDKAHPAIIPPTPTRAPFDLPRNVGRAEFEALQAQVANLAASPPPALGP